MNKLTGFDNIYSKRMEEILVANFALKSTCQLYQWKNEELGVFKANGCTILFSHNQFFYCFSNAHVLADAQLEKTFFLLQDKTTMTVGGDYFISYPVTSDRREDDSLDMAIVKLNPSVVERLLQNGHIFLTLDHIYTLTTLTIDSVLMIAGYPASKTKIDFEKMSLEFNPLIIQTKPYTRKLKNNLFTKGFHHIAEFPINSLKETGSRIKRRAPQPYGISGSGLWLISNKSITYDSPKLIGILSEYHENNAILISTKVDFFLELVRQRFDSSIQHNGLKIVLEYREE